MSKTRRKNRRTRPSKTKRKTEKIEEPTNMNCSPVVKKNRVNDKTCFTPERPAVARNDHLERPGEPGLAKISPEKELRSPD